MKTTITTNKEILQKAQQALMLTHFNDYLYFGILKSIINDALEYSQIIQSHCIRKN